MKLSGKLLGLYLTLLSLAYAQDSSSSTTSATSTSASTSTSSSTISSTSSSTASASASAAPAEDKGEKQCTRDNYTLNGPFCKPENNTRLITNDKSSYAITWDNSVFKNPDGDVVISISYVSTLNPQQPDRGTNIYDSTVKASIGIHYVTINPVWVRPGEGNSTVRVSLVKDGETFQGPFVNVTYTEEPKKEPKKRQQISTLGLAVGLPVVAVFIFLVLCGLHFYNREERRIGPVKFKRKGKHGYGERKSRAQRMQAAGGTGRDDGQDDWEMTNLSGDHGETTATGGAANTRQRPGGQTNPFSDGYTGR